MPRKKQLFEQGLAAARTLGLEQAYICPLCCRTFNSAALANGELTLEHVPPASRGGKAIILTCRLCNSRGGHQVDAHAASRDAMAQFMRVFLHGQPGEAGRARMTWGNESLTVDVSVDQTRTVDLKVIGDSNNPAKVRAASEFMGKLARSGKTDGYSFKITSFVRFHPRKAQISDLRSAYLACVARFGFRYALHEALNLIRAQIAKPNEQLLERWFAEQKLSVPTPTIKVFIEDGIVVVASGSAAVFLPWPSKPLQSYLQLTSLLGKQPVTLRNGQPVSWPKSFEAVLDHKWFRTPESPEGA